MPNLYRIIKWIYHTFKFGYYAPLIAIVLYTLFGAAIFKTLEYEEDEMRRNFFRNESEYAVNQVLDRLLEVRCYDHHLKKLDRQEQIRYAQDALYWFLDHLNLTQVVHWRAAYLQIIEERSDPSPWNWLGAMFYAGQLYTTIGYGFPSVKTVAGQFASIFYILIGIPIFLIILKDVGRLMSRALRKFYKRLKRSKIAQKTESIRRMSQTKKDIFKIDVVPEKEALANGKQRDLEANEQNKLNARLHAEMDFPIPIALAILSLWILFSAALFCIWESEWGYLTSVYFFFVSISTVGLGDIYPSKPDMMILNFILIVVGLALLSMCFNLIQVTVEKFLDRLLDEYIEEIGKMAEIVHQDDPATENAIPFEFKMSTGGLLSVPFRRVTESQGILSEVKNFFAEKVAENLIASRLGNDDDSDEEEEHSAKSASRATSHSGEAPAPSRVPASRRSSAAVAGHLLSQRHPIVAKAPLIKTIQTLEKIKPRKGDFKTTVFSKFLTSNKLSKLVEEAAPPPTEPKKMVTISCQTEPEPKMRRLCGRKKSRDSVSTVNTCDSVISTTPYKDIYFDYAPDVGVNESVLNMKSTLSILRIEDEEPILQSKLVKLRSPPRSRLPSKLPAHPMLSRRQQRLRHIPSSPGTFDSAADPSPLHDTRSLPSSEFSRLQSICGLLPSDFAGRRKFSLDSPSHGYKSTSSIDDSLFDQAANSSKY